MRVIRFELRSDDKTYSLFQSHFYYHYSTSMKNNDEYCLFQKMLKDLPVPPLDYYRGESYIFYFTREGFRRFKNVIAMIKKNLGDGVDLVMKRAWNLGLHAYADNFQVAVKV